MNYGASAYGSTSLGGLSAGHWQTFFTYLGRAVGIHEAKAEFTGTSSLYSIFARLSSDVLDVIFRVYTHNDPDETPQLQVTFGGFGNYFQGVIGAARFIIVRAEVVTALQTFEVHGRPGD